MFGIMAWWYNKAPSKAAPARALRFESSSPRLDGKGLIRPCAFVLITLEPLLQSHPRLRSSVMSSNFATRRRMCLIAFVFRAWAWEMRAILQSLLIRLHSVARDTARFIYLKRYSVFAICCDFRVRLGLVSLTSDPYAQNVRICSRLMLILFALLCFPSVLICLLHFVINMESVFQ
jgi:hypothetical protein